MLVIRMQRTGRKGLSQYRLVVQDSRKSASSGRIIASLGSYDPHTKTSKINTQKASFYIENGAQPSERAAKLLKENGVKMPKWFEPSTKKQGSIKNVEKLRKNRPAQEEPKEQSEAPAEEAPESAQTDSEAPAETIAEDK